MELRERLTRSLADRYTIEKEIDSGGMAMVYRARDLKHDRTVAIKVLRPDLAEAIGADRFLREIRTTASLSHPPGPCQGSSRPLPHHGAVREKALAGATLPLLARIPLGRARTAVYAGLSWMSLSRHAGGYPLSSCKAPTIQNMFPG